VWQSLYASLQQNNFTVVTVAMDEPRRRGHGSNWRHRVSRLIDRNHHVADLYIW
jgi:hypothetical protein